MRNFEKSWCGGILLAIMAVKNIAITLGAVLLAGLVLWGIYNGPLWIKRTASPGTSTATTTPATQIMSETASRGKADISSPEIEYGYTTPASSTVGKVVKADKAYPSLDRPVVIPASFSPEDAALVRERINKLTTAIGETPSNGALWANLGMERKGIEDYTSAIDAYEYALKMMPNNAVVAENLGVLYGDYLRDYAKAEEYYRLALTIDANAPHRYLRLFDLYQYALKDTLKAKAVLEEGLRAIPGEPSLQALLETIE